MPQVPHPQQRPRGPTNYLHAAAAAGSFETAAAGLASGALDINQADAKGWTALMIASRQGHSRIVRMFLDKGAEVLITEDRGYTALHQSAIAGHRAVTKMLVEAGAPLEVSTKQRLCTPLHLAALNGCAASTTTLLDAGANRNSRRFDGQRRYLWRHTKGTWLRTQTRSWLPTLVSLKGPPSLWTWQRIMDTWKW